MVLSFDAMCLFTQLMALTDMLFVRKSMLRFK